MSTSFRIGEKVIGDIHGFWSMSIDLEYFRSSYWVLQTSGTLQPTCISAVLQTFPQAALHGGRITDDVTTEVPSLRTTILPALKDDCNVTKDKLWFKFGRSDSLFPFVFMFFLLIVGVSLRPWMPWSQEHNMYAKLFFIICKILQYITI